MKTYLKPYYDACKQLGRKPTDSDNGMFRMFMEKTPNHLDYHYVCIVKDSNNAHNIRKHLENDSLLYISPSFFDGWLFVTDDTQMAMTRLTYDVGAIVEINWEADVEIEIEEDEPDTRRFKEIPLTDANGIMVGMVKITYND